MAKKTGKKGYPYADHMRQRLGKMLRKVEIRFDAHADAEGHEQSDAQAEEGDTDKFQAGLFYGRPGIRIKNILAGEEIVDDHPGKVGQDDRKPEAREDVINES